MGYWNHLHYPDDVEPEQLTEGSDFQQWRYKIDYALKRAVGADMFTSERAHLHKVGYPFKLRQQKASRDAAFVLYSNVSHRLQLRISNYQEKEPWELWEILEKISQPFPFLGLPRELRDVVYEEYLSSWENREEKGEREYWWHFYNWPYILRACRTIRNETIPIFYSRHGFFRNLGYEVGLNYSKYSLQHGGRHWHRGYGHKRRHGAEAPIHILLGDWTKALFRDEDQRRHLRNLRVSLDIGLPPSLFIVYFKFDVSVKRASQILNVTTRVHYHGHSVQDIVLRPQNQRRIQKHVEDCNALAESKDWKGEVIFHALKSDPELWMLGMEDLEQVHEDLVEIG